MSNSQPFCCGTVFRLGLDISATRHILNDADAGKIIDSFGSFVVGGNYIVGFVIFLIITLVQLIVITNGAGRTAEVSAVLPWMPCGQTNEY
jgi:flagellar biosynthesis protein FlhA